MGDGIDLQRCDGCKVHDGLPGAHFTGDQEWIKVFEVQDEAGNTVFLPRPVHEARSPLA